MSRLVRFLYWFLLVGAVGLGAVALQIQSHGLDDEDHWVNFWIAAILAGFLALIWGSLAIGLKMDQRRRRSVAATAASMGFSFDPAGGNMIGKGFLHLSRFQNLRPGEGLTLNAMQGSLPPFEDVVIFDFGTSRQSGNRTTSRTSTAMAFALARPVPEFTLEPGHLSSVINNQLRGNRTPIPFSSDPQFNRAYSLYCAETSDWEASLNPAFRSALQKNSNWHVTGGDHWLVFHQFNHQIDPEEIPSFLQEAKNLAAKFTSS